MNTKLDDYNRTWTEILFFLVVMINISGFGLLRFFQKGDLIGLISGTFGTVGVFLVLFLALKKFRRRNV